MNLSIRELVAQLDSKELDKYIDDLEVALQFCKMIRALGKLPLLQVDELIKKKEILDILQSNEIKKSIKHRGDSQSVLLTVFRENDRLTVKEGAKISGYSEPSVGIFCKQHCKIFEQIGEFYPKTNVWTLKDEYKTGSKETTQDMVEATGT